MRRNLLAMAITEEIGRQMRPRYLRIVATLLVHDRRPEVGDGAACICCGSHDAMISERRLIADIVIDTRTGRRIYEAQVPEASWAGYCSMAERYEIPLRCPIGALEMILDETGRHLFASGGPRPSSRLYVQTVRRAPGTPRSTSASASVSGKCGA